MLTNIKNFFDNFISPIGDETEDSHQHRLHLAAAALLIEVTRADYESDEREHTVVNTALLNMFDVTQDELDKIIELANEEVKDLSCYYEFTSLINKNFSAEEKVNLIEMMWQVVFADGVMDKYEEALVRKVSELLYVPHGDFIAAKHKVQSQLSS